MWRDVWLTVLILVCGTPIAVVAQGVKVEPKPTVWLPAPSALEEKIQAALAERTDLAFTDTPLVDSLDFLEDVHGIEIVLDVGASQAKQRVGEEPINLELSGITLRSALNLMLKPHGLTYFVEDGC